jgi:hypothetical protein
VQVWQSHPSDNWRAVHEVRREGYKFGPEGAPLAESGFEQSDDRMLAHEMLLKLEGDTCLTLSAEQNILV